jgi:hypothetical protein
LQSHDDVPEDIRQQLYAEEQQKMQKKRAVTTKSPGVIPSINITNVMPGSTAQTPLPHPNVAMPDTVLPLAAPVTCQLRIPGLRDVAVTDYCVWQQSQVRHESLKAEFRKARDAVLLEGLDLEQVHEDQDSEFLMKKGVKRGIARRFIRDIEVWAKRSRSDSM